MSKHLTFFSKSVSADLDREHSADLDNEHSAALDREHSAALDREHSAALDRQHSAALDREHSAALDREHSADLDTFHNISCVSETICCFVSKARRRNCSNRNQQTERRFLHHGSVKMSASKHNPPLWTMELVDFDHYMHVPTITEAYLYLSADKCYMKTRSPSNTLRSELFNIRCSIACCTTLNQLTASLYAQRCACLR